MNAARIELRPLPIKRAIQFNECTHRRLPKIQGGMWAIGAFVGGEQCGVVIVGNPQARMSDDGTTLEVLRLAVREGFPNLCSALYGAAARAARAMGARDLFTFIHCDESGHSLKASGWLEIATTGGGEWDRQGRQRRLSLDARPKRKFSPAWTRLARSVQGGGGAGTT